ncbi:MAG: ABC transporter ATP-binding protein [Chloroflexota bacterium]
MPGTAISARGIAKQYRRGSGGGWSLHGGVRALARLARGQRSGSNGSAGDTFWALDDVSFEVRRGERVGIVGRNGAGKSTLLKVLSRVVYPTRGAATIHGRLTSLLEVGTGFNENLTGRENVYLNASIHGLSRSEIDDRFDDIAEFAGVRQFLDTPVKRYSSGMQMRLAFSVAAHLDPDILLLDEVLAVGDLSFQQKCLERVEGLVSEGRTLLFVSHSLDAITRFCDRCLWLDNGRLREDGPAERVVEAYLQELAGVRSARSWVSGLPPTFEGRPDAAPESDWRSVEAEESPTAATSARADLLGDDDARLVAVRLVGADLRPRASIAVDEPLGVEVTFDVLRTGKNVQPALHFKGQTDQFLFVAAYTDPAWIRVPPGIGRHTATAWVPANWLNVGIVYVTVALHTPDPYETHALAERAVSFNVYERFDGGDTARGLYSRALPGAVRPLLQWETRRASGEASSCAETVGETPTPSGAVAP